MTSAQDKRYAAIKGTLEVFLSDKGTWKQPYSRVEIAKVVQLLSNNSFRHVCVCVSDWGA